jgi:hypothetical protein
MKSQLVLIEFNNSCPFVERFTSKRKITIDRVARFIEKRDGADWERDGITFIDEPTATRLEKLASPA